MKRETKSLITLTALIYLSIISYLVHTEPIVEIKKPVIFVKVQDWSKSIKGPKLGYLKHLYNSSE